MITKRNVLATLALLAILSAIAAIGLYFWPLEPDPARQQGAADALRGLAARA
jgi:predicted small lipoprotein YifL